jgi:hypothetical protein
MLDTPPLLEKPVLPPDLRVCDSLLFLLARPGNATQACHRSHHGHLALCSIPYSLDATHCPRFQTLKASKDMRNNLCHILKRALTAWIPCMSISFLYLSCLVLHSQPSFPFLHEAVSLSKSLLHLYPISPLYHS